MNDRFISLHDDIIIPDFRAVIFIVRERKPPKHQH